MGESGTGVSDRDRLPSSLKAEQINDLERYVHALAAVNPPKALPFLERIADLRVAENVARRGEMSEFRDEVEVFADALNLTAEKRQELREKVDRMLTFGDSPKIDVKM